MEFLSLDSFDPTFNLALEERLFTTLPPEHPGFFLLWQNNPSVIVGRNQCTAEEVNAAYVQRENLPVVRRMTGGGAVYHDAGNLNFSFLENRSSAKVDFLRFLEPVRLSLQDVGVTTHISGRNDLEADGRKISGNAQLLSRGKILHHGTLLVSLDFERMCEALTPAPEKIRSKGVASIRARVVNISELWPQGTTMEMLREALLARCADAKGTLNPGDALAAQTLARNKYRLWKWNYGASPPFSERKRERFPWGLVELRLDVRDGIIRSCRIYGDFFSAKPIGELEALLTGEKRRSATLKHVLAETDLEEFFSGCDADAMRCFLTE
ncbi:MAG: lipoate--protein ligase [Desulfovibrio sp.]|jgi:lipoate-protein ligase A|nr:lipoate--protein ligase [Desulfovibrio sp.]